MNTTTNQCALFTDKARAVSAVVQPVENILKAFEYAVNLCEKKRKERNAPDNPLSSPNGGGEDASKLPTLAAPALSADDFALLKDLCDSHHITIIKENLRNNLKGVDVGCTYADFGIAETGTLVINSTSEDLRLATMISDTHLAILPVSRLRQNDRAITPELHKLFADPANFTAFITGASRTADIERVLAIGVHGPLELHILLLEDIQC